MASEEIEKQREGAEVYAGDYIGRQKSVELLDEIELPNGLLPLKDILEVGYNRSTGFVWVTQKNQSEHKFKAANRLVCYDKAVTAFVEKRKMRKVTGVKAKELLIWVSIENIYVDEKDLGTLKCSNSLIGISRSFPTSAFQLEEVYK